MKKILLILLLLPVMGLAQGGWIKPNNSHGVISNGQSMDSAMAGPTGCGDPTSMAGINKYSRPVKKANYYLDTCGHRVWFYDPKIDAWDTLKGSGGGSTPARNGLSIVNGYTELNGSMTKSDTIGVTASGYLLNVLAADNTGLSLDMLASGNSNGPGIVNLNRQGFQQTGFKFIGKDHGFVKDVVENTETPSDAPGQYSDAASGFQVRNTFSGRFAQFYLGVDGNPFADSSLMIRTDGDGISLAVDNLGYIKFRGSASNNTSEYARFARGTGHLLIGSSTDVPNKKLYVNGSSIFGDTLSLPNIKHAALDTTTYKIIVQKHGDNGDLYETNWPAGGAGTTAFSSFSAANAVNRIDNQFYTQQWRWNSLIDTALSITSNSVAGNNNDQTLLAIALSGATFVNAQTSYGLSVDNSHTAGGSGTYVNVGAKFTASNATNNYALIVPSGSVGIGTSAPAKILHVSGTVRLASLGIAAFDTTTFKPLGISSSGDLLPITSWPLGSGSGVTSIGTINSQTKSANGAVITGTSLVMQTVDASFPGLMTSASKARLDSNGYIITPVTGVQIAKQVSVDTLRIKSLVAGADITITNNGDTTNTIAMNMVFDRSITKVSGTPDTVRFLNDLTTPDGTQAYTSINGVKGWNRAIKLTLTSPVDGDRLKYQASDSSFINYTPELPVLLGSDVTNNNASANTIADVTGLSFAVVSGNTYSFKFVVNYTSAVTTTGSRWSVNGPTTTFLSYRSNYALTTTTETPNNGLTAYDLPAASNASSAATGGNIAVVEGIIKPSANGTVICRFASEVSSSAIVAKAGSYVEWHKLN